MSTAALPVGIGAHAASNAPCPLSATGSPFDLERREHTTRGLHGGPRGVRSLQDRLTHLDLFSGIGGFALAAQWAGIRTIGFSEIEPYASRVLAKNFPDVPNYGDIRKLTGVRADIITGGFPCQPFSLAGERRGKEDDRHLWPEMLRVIADARPTWVVGENVPGIIGLELDNVLSDLEASGYAAWPVVVPACALDARHRRDRVWIVAHANGRDGAGEPQPNLGDVPNGDGEENGNVADANGAGLGEQRRAEPISAKQRASERAREAAADADRQQARRVAVSWRERGEWQPEPAVGRVAHGIPKRLDRLRGLGNSIVPQVAFVFLDAIAAIEFEGAVADARGGSAWERVSGRAELSRAQMENAGHERARGTSGAQSQADDHAA